MSNKTIENITCPICKHKDKFAIWDNISVLSNPEIQKSLIDGKLFLYECKNCGNATHVFYPCIYNDEKNKVMIHLVEEKDIDSTVEAIKLTAQRLKEINLDNLSFKLPGMDLSYKKRVVSNVDSLREKAIIFKNELDDRVIEIIKLLYYIRACDDHPTLNISDAYFFIENGEYRIQFIGDRMFSAIIQKGLYDEIKHIYVDNLNEDKDFIINMLWANKIMIQLEDGNE